ncbi:MAG: hypothetical protein HS115_16395 [Spirochaetales bacterium]|nr:hypothetical protein [Spirochaetales bacterium]
MSLYTLDIQLPAEESGGLLRVFQHNADKGLELVSSNILYRDLYSAYFRVELLSSHHDKADVSRIIEENFKKAHYIIRDDLSVYRKPLIEMSPRKFSDTRRAFMITAPETLEEARRSWGADSTEKTPLARYRVALLSDGSACENPASISMDLERDAYLIARYASLQPVPLWVRTRGEEDLIRTAQALAGGFSALRLSGLDNRYALEVVERLQQSLDIPVIHAERLETAILILSVLINIYNGELSDFQSMNAAVIGLSAAGHGTAELLLEAGFQRVFGIDADPIQLTHFERGRGIASSLDHVYSAADIIVIMPEVRTVLEEKRFRENQLVLNFSSQRFDHEKSPARIFRGSVPHPIFILPGLTGLVQNKQIRQVTSELCWQLITTLTMKKQDQNILPLPSQELIRRQMGLE